MSNIVVVAFLPLLIKNKKNFKTNKKLDFSGNEEKKKKNLLYTEINH